MTEQSQYDGVPRKGMASLPQCRLSAPRWPMKEDKSVEIEGIEFNARLSHEDDCKLGQSAESSSIAS